MYVDQSAVWHRAYDSTWGSMECVEGSTEHASSVTGGGDITAGPPKMARNFFGGDGSIVLGAELGSVLRNTSSGGSGSGNSTTAGGNGTSEGNGGGKDSENGTNTLVAPFVLALSLAVSVVLLLF
jgi:hypothetical protein